MRENVNFAYECVADQCVQTAWWSQGLGAKLKSSHFPQTSLKNYGEFIEISAFLVKCVEVDRESKTEMVVSFKVLVSLIIFFPMKEKKGREKKWSLYVKVTVHKTMIKE